MTTTAVEVRDLTVAYKDKPVLWSVDMQAPSGALMAIVGPNGAGKTTLIKAILGLVRPLAGQALIYGKPYLKQRHLVAYVPQRSSVDWDFPTSVLDVVMMGRYGALGWLKRPGAAERRAALEALDKVGMVDFAERQIGQLSGGQQQRLSRPRWFRTQKSTSWTSRFRASTPRRSGRSCGCCRSCVRRGRPCSSCTTTCRRFLSISTG